VADAELNAHRIAFIIEHREERLLLPVERVEMAQAAVAGIVLKCGCPSFGEIVGHPCRRCEIERTRTLERSVEDRIDDQINGTDATADDWPDFGGIAGRLPIARVVAELEIDAVKEASVLGVWDDKLGTQLGTVDQEPPATRPARAEPREPLIY
jgi:hypothetical protein